MGFDLATAAPVEGVKPKFDLSSAKPVGDDAPPADSTLKQLAMAPVGAAEEFLKAGTGALASIPAGLAYGGAAVGKALGADVNPSEIQSKVSKALTYQPVSNSGQAADQAFADTYGPVGKAVADKADQAATAVGKVSPTAETFLREAPHAAAAAGAIVPVAASVRAAAGEISAANAAAKANRPWEAAGLRTADDHPIARNVAGPSGKEALTLHNLPVGNTIAANDAGVAAGRPLSEASLKAAQAAPNAVYARVEKGLPTTSLVADKDTTADIKAAGSPKGGRITTGSPAAQQQIEKLRAELLDPDRQFTGTQVVNELRGLRQEAGVNAASEDVSNQQIGDAQHDMAAALEAHIERNLPKDGDVSLEQFQGARRALAKNYTVQGALRGKYVDPQALARVHTNNPGLLDGGLETYAQFAADHPEVSSLPSPGTRYNPPSLSRDVSDIDLKKPITYPQPLVGAAARRVLTGGQGAALDQANAAFPPRSPQAFAPIPPPPPPRIAGLLPSPAMVNAGNGVTTSGALDNLGLTPDVQAAAAAHPGAPRLGALQQTAPARSPMAGVDMQGPQNWAPALQANGVPPIAPPPQGGIPMADLMAHGVEKPPAPGLSLAPMEAPASGGIPFQRNADFEATGTRQLDKERYPVGVPAPRQLRGAASGTPVFRSGPELALAPEDSWFNTSNRARMQDMARVMSQGVPDGTMLRTAPGRSLANNASGESAASMEAISRGTRPLELVNPDGIGQPVLRDVTQVDRSAPKGHLIIDTSTGEIVSRGPDLTEAAANGLRKRWAIMSKSEKSAEPNALSIETPEQTRQRLLAKALRDK